MYHALCYLLLQNISDITRVSVHVYSESIGLLSKTRSLGIFAMTGRANTVISSVLFQLGAECQRHQPFATQTCRVLMLAL